MDGKDSCVFRRNWMDVAQTIEDMKMRCLFYEAVLQYAMNGMEIDAPPELKYVLKLLYGLIDADRAKYEKICERRREAAKKGAQKTNELRWGKNQQMSPNGDNYQQMSPNVAITDTETETDTETDTEDSKESILNNTPIPPRGGNGWSRSFEDLVNRVSKVEIPKRIIECKYELQYVWRMSEGNPGYGVSISRAISKNQSKEALCYEIQEINKRYKPMSAFSSVKLAYLLCGMGKAKMDAFMAELDRAGSEQGIYEVLIAKAEYIKSGNKVTSLAAFLKSRQTNK